MSRDCERRDAAAPPVTTASSVPILMYHSIADERRGELARWTLAPEAFAEHLAYLRAHGYVTYTISELAAALPDGRSLAGKPIALTFDDAYRDFLEHAQPALAKHGCTATVFVPTAYIGKATTWISPQGPDARAILDAEQLRHLADAGIECGAHSHTHPEMDRLSAADLRRETAQSKATLEEVIHRQVTSFAYPFGYFDARARQAVISAGYGAACAVGEVMGSLRSDRHTLPRLTVSANTGVKELDRLLARAPSPLAWPRAKAKQVAWRQVRRGIGLVRARGATAPRAGG